MSLNGFFALHSDKTSANEPAGIMSSVYGYVLNDYMLEYGVLYTDADGNTISGGGAENPEGVIYGDLLYFDGSEYPYLTVFAADGTNKTVFCHIWGYSDETENAECIAKITKSYADIAENRNGEFNVGWTDDRRHIAYNVYEDYSLVSSEFYTVIDDEAFMYVNNPSNVMTAGVADFNSAYFHTGIDSSEYNQSLDDFFTSLRDSAAASVTFENIADRIGSDDTVELSRVLIRAALHSGLDISNYETDADYNAALENPTSSDTFSSLTALYDLGDGIYYAMFDTTRSVYNYAVLRKSDDAKNGYQILRVNTDCIPLADRELKRMKIDYICNPLLYEMSEDSLALEKSGSSAKAEPDEVTVKVGDSPSVVVGGEADVSEAEVSETDSSALDAVKFPAACIGGGVSLALLAALWLYLCTEH